MPRPARLRARSEAVRAEVRALAADACAQGAPTRAHPRAHPAWLHDCVTETPHLVGLQSAQGNIQYQGIIQGKEPRGARAAFSLRGVSSLSQPCSSLRSHSKAVHLARNSCRQRLSHLQPLRLPARVQ
eukprot:224822-Rhodomonas_salina.1